MAESRRDLLQIFHVLENCFGPQHWWPASSPWEMAVGAILTQNTAWANVEKALANLREANALTLGAMASLPAMQLEGLIRPAGFFRQKTACLQGFASYLQRQWRGDLLALLARPLPQARNALLLLRGIGPETADSILLYAGQRPVFVVDAYTRRLLYRLGLLPGRGRYQELQAMFLADLPADPGLFNEFHALIVAQAKHYCRKRKPLCVDCPLSSLCSKRGC